MALLYFGQLLRRRRAEQVEPLITNGTVKLYTGSAPASCAAALSGNTLAGTITIPADCLQVFSSSTTTLNGSWTGTGDTGLGAPVVATFYRMFHVDGTTCHIQGDVTATGGGGSLTLASTTIMKDQALQVTSFTKPEPNAIA